MKLNGHELEMKYVAMATELAIAKQNPKWSDILWTGKFKRQLKKRLIKLKESYDNGFIDRKAFAIWNNMIKNAL
jgi:hypothetical protein